MSVKIKGEKDQPVKTITALLDSGASSTIMYSSTIKNQKNTEFSPTTWSTANGSFETVAKSSVAFILPELTEQRVVHANVHVTTKRLNNYDMIIGRDLLTELGLRLDFDSKTITWDDYYCPIELC